MKLLGRLIDCAVDSWRIRVACAIGITGVLGGACVALEHSGFCNPGNPHAGETLDCYFEGPPECMGHPPAWEYQAASINRCAAAILGEQGMEECDSVLVKAKVRRMACKPGTCTETQPSGGWIDLEPGCVSRTLTGRKCRP